MAMLITRFHKLIQSKVLWYFILGIIVISFVGFFMPTNRSETRQHVSRPAGELYGKKVSQDEYRRAYHNTYTWYILSSGRMIPMTDELTTALRKEAWQRVAVLHKAQADKIVVADQEVIQQLQAMPLFHAKNGAFDSNVYKAVLKQLDFTPRQAEELFREQIAIYKLMYRPAQAALISPYELKHAYHLYTDRFVLDYVVVPRSQVEKTVAVSKEAAQALFAGNPEAFRMPAKVRVSYVEFAVSNFLVKAEIPEGAALQVYNRNIENYRIENTNENAVVEYKPFEKVEGEITKQLRQAAARKLAAEKATEFVVEVSPKTEGGRPDFAGAAAAAKLKIKTLPPFGIKDDLKGIDDTAPFRQTAFSLENDAYTSFSDAVVGKDSVYVLSLDQRYPSFVPTFDAVEKEVMAAAREQAVVKVLAEHAIEIEKTIATAMASGTGFKEAVKPLGLKVQTTPEFDLSTELKDKYSDTLIAGCLNVPQGKLCKPAPVDGGVLIAFVNARKSTDEASGLPALRQELTAGLSRSRSQRLASGWQESLLSEANFKDLTHKPAE
ncbi:MAG: SurA N-terminal domain-containing protein [Kiritimatiellales bacterium]